MDVPHYNLNCKTQKARVDALRPGETMKKMLKRRLKSLGETDADAETMASDGAEGFESEEEDEECDDDDDDDDMDPYGPAALNSAEETERARLAVLAAPEDSDERGSSNRRTTS